MAVSKATYGLGLSTNRSLASFRMPLAEEGATFTLVKVKARSGGNATLSAYNVSLQGTNFIQVL